MNKLATLIAEGKITVEELSNANELIERAKLVTKGILACKKTISFPLGVDEIMCYDYTDSAGEYHSWATCNKDGIFTCFCNWGGNHELGRVNLTNYCNLFMAFEDGEMAHNLKRFLMEQITKTC